MGTCFSHFKMGALKLLASTGALLKITKFGSRTFIEKTVRETKTIRGCVHVIWKNVKKTETSLEETEFIIFDLCYFEHCLNANNEIIAQNHLLRTSAAMCIFSTYAHPCTTCTMYSGTRSVYWIQWVWTR